MYVVVILPTTGRGRHQKRFFLPGPFFAWSWTSRRSGSYQRISREHFGSELWTGRFDVSPVFPNCNWWPRSIIQQRQSQITMFQTKTLWSFGSVYFTCVFFWRGGVLNITWKRGGLKNTGNLHVALHVVCDCLLPRILNLANPASLRNPKKEPDPPIMIVG